MSRKIHLVNPFLLPDVIPDMAEKPEEASRVVEALSDDLKNRGFVPAGTRMVNLGHREQVDDPGCVADLTQLVRRATEQPVNIDGIDTVRTIDLATLRFEVDRDGEICCWLYAYK